MSRIILCIAQIILLLNIIKIALTHGIIAHRSRNLAPVFGIIASISMYGPSTGTALIAADTTTERFRHLTGGLGNIFLPG